MLKHALPFLIGVLVGWLVLPYAMGLLSGLTGKVAAPAKQG